MQILREGDRIRVKAPFMVNDNAISSGLEGVVDGVGPAWDRPIDVTYVGVILDDGRRIDLPLTRAAFLFERL